LGRAQAKHPPAGAKSLLNDARSFRAAYSAPSGARVLI
jgi:hypothetical protein